MQEVYIISGARTPVGVLQGSLSDVTAIELGVIAAKVPYASVEDRALLPS